MEPEAEQRFAALASRMTFIEKSVDGLDRRCADIEGALMTNTGLTERTSHTVEMAAQAIGRLEGSVHSFQEEMRGLLTVVHGTRRAGNLASAVGRMVNRVARWLMPIVVATGAAWAWLQNVWHHK